MNFRRSILNTVQWPLSIILFSAKFLFVPEWLFYIFTAGLKKITRRKITNGISCSKKCAHVKECSMDIPLIDLWNIRKYDYFQDQSIVVKKFIEIIFRGNDWENLNAQTFTTQTNSQIVRILNNSKLNPYYSKMEISTTDKYTAIQPIEKLSLMNYSTFIKNLFKPRLYRTIFRKEKIYVISITIK